MLLTKHSCYVKNKYRLYRFAGYILLAIVIYFYVDFRALIDNLSKISISASIILIAIATLDRFIMAVKWMQLSTALNMAPVFSRFLKIYYVATFLGYCLPTSVGGEVYKATRLSMFEQSHDVLASMLMEKIIGIFSTVSFAWAGVLYITLSLTSENSILLFNILAGLTVAALLATWASLHSAIHDKLIEQLSRFRIGSYIEKLTKAYSGFKNHRKTLIWNLLLALIETALQLLIMCGIAIALDIEISLPVLASIIAITEFIRRFAMILDGWGFATALQIFMYSLVGMTGAQALLIALLSHAVHFIASLPGGILILTDRWDKN